jgi:hypothetical protein
MNEQTDRENREQHHLRDAIDSAKRQRRSRHQQGEDRQREGPSGVVPRPRSGAAWKRHPRY